MRMPRNMESMDTTRSLASRSSFTVDVSTKLTTKSSLLKLIISGILDIYEQIIMGCTKSKPIATKLTVKKNSLSFVFGWRKNRVRPIKTITETTEEGKRLQSSLSARSTTSRPSVIHYDSITGAQHYNSPEPGSSSLSVPNPLKPPVVSWGFLHELQEKMKKERVQKALTQRRNELRAEKELEIMWVLLKKLERAQSMEVEYEEKYKGLLHNSLLLDLLDIEEEIKAELKHTKQKLTKCVTKKYELLRHMNAREAKADFYLARLCDDPIRDESENATSLAPIPEETFLQVFEALMS